MKQVRVFNSQSDSSITLEVNEFLESIKDTAIIDDIVYKINGSYNCVIVIYTVNWGELG